MGPAEPLGRLTPPGSESLSNFIFEFPRMVTSHFHTCEAAERKFSPGFGFKMILSFSFLPHLHLDLLALIPSTTLIIPHGRQGDRPIQKSLVHIHPRGEPSPANLALETMEVDQEAEHIAKTPLVVIPAPASKEAARGAKGGSAEPPWWPLGLPFDAAHHQEDPIQEGQVPGLHVRQRGCSHRRTSPRASSPICFHRCR